MNKRGAFIAGATSGIVICIVLLVVFVWWASSSVTNTKGPMRQLGAHTSSYVDGYVWFADQTRQAALKQALSREQIPYLVSFDAEGRERISWAPENDDRAKRVQASLFGELPPFDRSLCSRPPNVRFKKWLIEQGISFTTSNYLDSECVILAEKDKSAVARWEAVAAPCEPDTAEGTASNHAMQPNLASCARSSADRKR